MSFTESNEFIKNILPFVTLVIGAWLGNRYAVSKDRRKEFLEISIPIHMALISQIHAKGDGIFNNRVADKDLIILRSFYFNRTLLDRVKGVGLDAAIAEYQKQYNVSYSFGNDGRVVYTNHDSYLKAVKGLLKYASIK